MTLIPPFNPDNLKFIVYNAKKDQLPILKFAQSNGEDPLKVQEYYDHFRTRKLPKNTLFYALRYEEQWIGFFSAGFTILNKSEVGAIDGKGLDSLVMKTDENFTYKALLIHKIGIDQKYRCFGIGKYILLFCIGLAKSRWNCAQVKIVVFRTTRSLAEKIYYPKYRFSYVGKDKKLVWAYKKIC
ncbi:MAG TPA: hypothetical protein VD815_02320 [Candidatus Saccharimonadales bacterium]|nr:hypothetical protein [Candidatus Saccharimonadales bacterium]